jgi:hypothetical protein
VKLETVLIGTKAANAVNRSHQGEEHWLDIQVQFAAFAAAKA